MNDRERFVNSMHFRPADRVSYRPQGFWQTTLERWLKEGMLAGVEPGALFGFDQWRRVPMNVDMLPLMEVQLVEEADNWRIVKDEHGVTKRELRVQQEMSMPQWLDFPVSNADDFRRMKARYDASAKERYPADWPQLVESYRGHDYVLGVDLYGGLYMTLRGWMGAENLMYAFLEQPALVEEMLEFYTDFLIQMMTPALKTGEVDYVSLSEDIAYKNGPFVSPAMFKRFLAPCYKRLSDLIRSCGVDLFLVDSDGDPRQLIGPMLEAGINGIHPNEVAAGVDVVALRKQYGKDLMIWCGIDKRALARDKAAIEREVRSKVPYMISQGGYLPQVDHGVPPDVSYENFCYYWDLIRQIAERE